MRLKRYPANPILRPNKNNDWESELIFNPAVVYHNDLFHLFYRAIGVDTISRIGYAMSSDGFNFFRLDKPIFSPRGRLESQGCEDPRITKIEDKFYIVYTAYSNKGVRIAIASTTNFIHWEKLGIILDELGDNKDGVLFPEKINGKYVLLHRPMNEKPLSIWIAYSDDLIHWYDSKKIMEPRSNYWDNRSIGAGCPPIKTEKGWLHIYHGVTGGSHKERTYRLGVVFFDLKDPSKIVYRHPDFILEPEEDYELRGEVNEVVFACGICEFEDNYHIYYGGADRVICVATIAKKELLNCF